MSKMNIPENGSQKQANEDLERRRRRLVNDYLPPKYAKRAMEEYQYMVFNILMGNRTYNG